MCHIHVNNWQHFCFTLPIFNGSGSRVDSNIFRTYYDLWLISVPFRVYVFSFIYVYFCSSFFTNL